MTDLTSPENVAAMSAMGVEPVYHSHAANRFLQAANEHALREWLETWADEHDANIEFCRASDGYAMDIVGPEERRTTRGGQVSRHWPMIAREIKAADYPGVLLAAAKQIKESER